MNCIRVSHVHVHFESHIYVFVDLIILNVNKLCEPSHDTLIHPWNSNTKNANKLYEILVEISFPVAILLHVNRLSNFSWKI